MPGTDKKNCIILIPCYNEAGSLEPLIQAVRKHQVACDFLIINDGSTDLTKKIAAKLADSIHLPYNVGIGGAVQSGFKFAWENKYSYCVRIDGDGQHPPEEIDKLIHAAKEHQANIVIGSRFLNKGGYQSTVFRRFGIRLICKTIRWLTGITITDPTSGFCYYDQKAIQIFKDDFPFDFPEPVSILIAKLHNLKVIEASVYMEPRTNGVSSISVFKAPIYMLRVIFNLFFVYLRRAA